MGLDGIEAATSLVHVNACYKLHINTCKKLIAFGLEFFNAMAIADAASTLGAELCENAGHPKASNAKATMVRFMARRLIVKHRWPIIAEIALFLPEGA